MALGYLNRFPRPAKGGGVSSRSPPAGGADRRFGIAGRHLPLCEVIAAGGSRGEGFDSISHWRCLARGQEVASAALF